MSSTTQSVDELIQQTPSRNNEDKFAKMWAILGEVRAKIDRHFHVRLDPSVADLADYGTADGTTKGHLTAWSGEEIDWMVHSYMGTPERSFCNMHLTVWLGPQIDVPHFGMALGTIPDMFVYLDLVPRADLAVDLDYLDRYYEPRNATYLRFEAHPEFSPFISRSLYMRQAQSRTSLCYMADPSEANIELVRQAAHEKVDAWLELVKNAKPVPAEQQAALAARDLHVRRAISQRDPANVMGEKIFGKDLTSRLVGTLWGEGRHSKRAGSWQQ